MDILGKVKKTIEKFNMINPGDKIIVGVSGGPDSVTLLHILWRLKEELNISLITAHLNHGLRGKDAILDEEFVLEFSAKLGIPVKSEKVNVHDFAKENNLSLEEAGRRLRYDFFKRVAEIESANKVALGHNLDDNAETVLMRIIRGTGVDGLGGMPIVRDLTEKIKIIRPLMEVTREEIIKHLKISKLAARVDKTNLTRTYLRNKIRLDLLPFIEKKFNGNIKRNLVNLAEIMSSENDFFLNTLSDIFTGIIQEIPSAENKIVLYKDKLINLHPAIKRRIIRKCMQSLIPEWRQANFEHIEEIITALNKQCNLDFELPGGIKVLFRYNSIIITSATVPPGAAEEIPVNYEYEVKIPGRTEIKESGLTVDSEFVKTIDFSLIKRDNTKAYFDVDLLNLPLTIRNKKQGDKFIPYGLSGEKKIKEFFIDKKILREKRNKIPVILDKNSNIIWVVGYRTDDRFKITSATKNIIKLEAKYGST